MSHGKTISTERNDGRKSALTERYRRTVRRVVSKNHRIAAVHVTGKQNWVSILKTLFPKKLSDVSFTNPAFTTGLPLLNIWFLKLILRCLIDGVTTIKTGNLTTCNGAWCGHLNIASRSSPRRERVYVLKTTKQACKMECLVPTMKHVDALWWFGQQFRKTVFCWSHYYHFVSNNCKEVSGQVG
jgi:hypothetical protein